MSLPPTSGATPQASSFGAPPAPSATIYPTIVGSPGSSMAVPSTVMNATPVEATLVSPGTASPFASYVPPPQQQASYADQVDAVFDAMDSNHDGIITREEFDRVQGNFAASSVFPQTQASFAQPATYMPSATILPGGASPPPTSYPASVNNYRGTEGLLPPPSMPPPSGTLLPAASAQSIATYAPPAGTGPLMNYEAQPPPTGAIPPPTMVTAPPPFTTVASPPASLMALNPGAAGSYPTPPGTGVPTGTYSSGGYTTTAVGGSTPGMATGGYTTTAVGGSTPGMVTGGYTTSGVAAPGTSAYTTGAMTGGYSAAGPGTTGTAAGGYTAGAPGSYTPGGVPGAYAGGAAPNGYTTGTAAGGYTAGAPGVYAPGGVNGSTVGGVDARGLFMDDNKNWKIIADIAESLMTIETDEAFFAEELAKLPGGREALAFLRGGPGADSQQMQLPAGWVQEVDPATGRPVYVNQMTGERSFTPPPGSVPLSKEAALDKVKQSIEAARGKALQKAGQARQQAQAIKKDGDDAENLTGESESIDDVLEAEHLALDRAAKQARDAEAKADAEARKLAQQAADAARDAQNAQNEANQATQHAQQHHHYANHVTGKADQARQAAEADAARRDPIYGAGGGGDPALSALDGEEAQTAHMLMDAKKAKKGADRANADLNDRLARLARLEQANTPGSPMTQVVQVQKQVEGVDTAKNRVAHLQKKAAGLEGLIRLLTKQLDGIRRETAVADNDQRTKQAQVAQAAQQAQAAAAAAGVTLNPDGSIATAGGRPLTAQEEHELAHPEEIPRLIAQARADVARAQQQAQQETARAQDLGQKAQKAEKDVVKHTLEQDVYGGLDQLDYEAEKARMNADQAKAKADALRAAADSALKHAGSCHQRAHMANTGLQKQRAHTADVVGRERAAWQKRFGDLPQGWTAQVGPDGNTYFIGPNGERLTSRPKVGPNGVVALPGQQNYVIGPDGRPMLVTTGGPAGLTEAQQEEQRLAAMRAAQRKSMEEALKAEAEAHRMDELVRCLERAMTDRSQLERDLAAVRDEAKSAQTDVERMAAIAEQKIMAPTLGPDGMPQQPGYGQGYDGLDYSLQGQYAPQGQFAPEGEYGGYTTQGQYAPQGEYGGYTTRGQYAPKDQYGGQYTGYGGQGQYGGYGTQGPSPKDLFDMIDKDGDGVITREEFEKARMKAGSQRSGGYGGPNSNPNGMYSQGGYEEDQDLVSAALSNFASYFSPAVAG